MSKAEAKNEATAPPPSPDESLSLENAAALSEPQIARLRFATLTMIDVPRFKLPDSVLIRLVR